MTAKITWRREQYKTALATVMQGPRGWCIKVDDEYVGMVSPLGKWDPEDGWYWYANANGALRNTAAECRIYDTPVDAARECDAWVRKQIGIGPRRTPLMLITDDVRRRI